LWQSRCLPGHGVGLPRRAACSQSSLQYEECWVARQLQCWCPQFLGRFARRGLGLGICPPSAKAEVNTRTTDQDLDIFFAHRQICPLSVGSPSDIRSTVQTVLLILALLLLGTENAAEASLSPQETASEKYCR